MTQAPDGLDDAARTALAKSLYNQVWTLLDAPDRSQADNDEMVNAAHASRLFWSSVGGPTELAIGEWQISRVYATLGRGEPAVHHAHRCHEFAQAVPDETWLLGSAYEGLARAYMAAGDREEARDWRGRAEAQLDLIDDPEDREIVARDVATLPV